MGHDIDTPVSRQLPPANRLGLDYRQVPPRKVATLISDVHSHVYLTDSTPLFFEAAELYGITKIVSMSPLDEVDRLHELYPGRLAFIAVPRWRNLTNTADFAAQWIADLATFREKGATRMKFWSAPPMRERHGLTLSHPFYEPVIQTGLDLGYDFMVHVGDPVEWFAPGGKYADASIFGTKEDQYPQLVHFLERVAPRTVIAAHMGGSIEDLGRLARLLDQYPQLYLDSSATKWIVRGVATQPAAVRDFLLRYQDRVLFGSDLVVGEKYDFDHYASRYWCHQMMWETAYRGESPIDDPDAPQPPRLAGVDLPPEVLEKLYRKNAVRLGYASQT